jgi:hypothetical protein
METPASIVPHADKSKPDAWENYSLLELGSIIHFFVKRAGHRTDPAKKAKDLKDARNYLAMMQAHIDAAS